MPRIIELLSPAKDYDTAIAAINCGADAIYIGASKFGARALAGNSVSDIAKIVEYAHLFDVKVYVTINTIIKDSELKDVESLINELYRIGVDAIIVQDMGLLRLDLPPISLHASTQCDIRTPEKARFLEDVGFSQLVLPRELTLNEIKSIKSNTSVPLESFVHGALCVCYSGRCHASETFKNRSANRGECAQICRLPYSLYDADGNELIKNKHLLSLKDLNQSNYLLELLDAGVSSLKIEGRLKDQTYVKNVVYSYDLYLNKIIESNPGKYIRSSKGQINSAFNPDLNKSFNRGYTNYFISDRNAKKLASFYTPKSMGEYIGKVRSIKGNTITIETNYQITNGDGISFFDKNNIYTGFRVNTSIGNQITTHQKVTGLNVGMNLYRTYSKEFEDLIMKPTARKILVNFELIVINDEIQLIGVDEYGIKDYVIIDCDAVYAEKSQNEAQKRILSKLGDTHYLIGNIKTLDAIFIPASKLADARRNLIDKLLKKKLSSYTTEKRRTENKNVKFITNKITYRDNVSNHLASQFYTGHGVTNIESAIELLNDKSSLKNHTLMTTRYCLRRELGLCKKVDKSLKEPLTLRAQGGIEFIIEFDCKKCEMKLLKK